MKALYFLFISVCIILVQACTCKNPENFFITQKTKDYFLTANKGSYFVYENVQDSLDQDTLTIDSVVRKMVFNFSEKHCDGDYYENISYNLINSKSKDTLKVKISTNNNIDFYLLSGQFKKTKPTCFFDINKPNSRFEIYTYDEFETAPILTVKNKEYKDGIKVTFHQLASYKGEAPVYCYSKNLGLVYFKAPINSERTALLSYYLVAYKIVH